MRATVDGLGTGVAVLAGATWAWWSFAAHRRRHQVRRRLAALTATTPGRPPGRAAAAGRWHTHSPSRRRAVRDWVVPLGAALTAWALVGGLPGCAAGAAAAYGVRRRQRRPRPPGAAEEEAGARQLPLVADLLAACLAAGASPQEAAAAVGASLDGPAARRLARAAAELRLGGEPAEVWGRFGELRGARPLARCLERAGASGAPAAEAVARLATALRAEQARAAEARGRRAQVLITAPVGLCFLPAFLAVGVAPVVIGLASALL
ncbi:type II secretion system F family protein [Streptomyces sp. ODS05-4]|uniref:type II secretion system F family protein n=1 Tax=Streptomyces sp. ODS05-4 TaxID=2944939 RepID=UPI00210C2E94|nr:type II secretion system F family protein [Streptomyces sp. ODS05-4]